MSDNPIFLKLQRDMLEVMRDMHREAERIKFTLLKIEKNTRKEENDKQ